MNENESPPDFFSEPEPFPRGARSLASMSDTSEGSPVVLGLACVPARVAFERSFDAGSEVVTSFCGIVEVACVIVGEVFMLTGRMVVDTGKTVVVIGMVVAGIGAEVVVVGGIEVVVAPAEAEIMLTV